MNLDYSILVNKNNGIDEKFVNETVVPNLVRTESIKNNNVVFDTFKIKERVNFLEKETYKNFRELQNYCKKNGVILDITSGYLSFEQQKSKYDYFVKSKGIEFAKKSACLAGYSEHNTGLCLDCDLFINGKWCGIALNKDGSINNQTAWLHTILHKFGFILRYPKGKENITNMKFEPWHIRYVGNDLAKYLYENKLTLEEYHQQKIKTNTEVQ